MCNWKKWVWPWGLLPLILAIIAILMKSGPVEEELTGRASEALNAQHSWANVSLDGRDLTLSGTAPTEAAKAEAVDLADGAYDVRIVKDDTDLLALASPYNFGADIDGNAITLRGNMPNETARATLLEATKASNPTAEITDNTTLARGASVAFPALAAFGAAKLADLSSGSVDISDADFSIKGVAKTSDAFEKVTASVGNALPDGGTLALSDITPPALDVDYAFSASLDETPKVTLDGYAPTVAARSALTDYASAAFPNAEIENNLALAAGAPEGYDAASKFAIDQLPRFKSGSASFTGSDFTVSGVSSTSDDFTAARAAIAGALPAGLVLDSSAIVPPSAEGEYSMAAAKTDGSLRLSGLAPSTDMRDAIASAAAESNPDLEIVNDLKIAAGAPTDMAWDQAAGFGLGQMSKLRDGSMSLNSNGLSVSGEAIDGPSFEALNAMPAGDLPEGMAVESVDVQLPAASPYTWSLAKTGNDLEINGFAPSRDVADATAAQAAEQMSGVNITDNQQLAAGAPADYRNAVAMSLATLAPLTNGSASLSDNALSLSGDAASLAQRSVAESKVLSKGALEVTKAITSPTIDPYTWSATKGEDSVFLSGYVPSVEAKEANVAAAKALTTSGSVIDQQVLGEGAPDGYSASTAKALSALGMLEKGKAQYSSGDLTVSGETKDLAGKLALAGAMAGGAAVLDISAPKVSPYTWSATKAENSVFLSGYVPNETIKAKNVEAAKALTSSGSVIDQQVLAEGVPTGYGSALAHAFKGLGALETGKASYSDGTLAIDGDAKDLGTKNAAMAMLAKAPAFTEVSSTVRSPIVNPYTWSATKGESSVFLSGYVPNEAVKAKNVEAAKALTSSGAVIDQQVLAEGVPTGYGSGIQYGLDALKSLETGKAAYSSGQLNITGHAGAFETKLALDDSLEAKAPAFTTVSATITSPEPPAPALPELPTPPAPPEAPVIPEPEPEPESEPVVEAEPALPVASPYVWAMVKTEGDVTLSGHMPSENGVGFALDKATDVAEGLEVKNEMTVATGEPAGFGSAVAFGSDILGRLIEGEARIKNQVLSINGRAIDHEMKEKLDAEVANNSLNFTVVTSNITAPPKPEPKPENPDIVVRVPDLCEDLVKSAQGARYLNFATNSAEITGSRAAVDEIIFVAQRCSTVQIEISGHTDSRGAAAYNQNLSEARANSVRDYMINSAGISASRITAIGAGETQPIADNNTAEGRALNRRISFSISR